MRKKVIIGLFFVVLLVVTNHRTKTVYIPVAKCGARVAYGTGHLIKRVSRSKCHNFVC